MIESITWYLNNTKETLPKFQENCIYIYKKKNCSYEYISYILSLQFEIVTKALIFFKKNMTLSDDLKKILL
jgi:hypothetical protein